MIEKWKHILGKHEYVKTLFNDLSEAFETLNHTFLLAKPNAS